VTLEGRTLFISGGSRGIGLAIAIRAARDGANVALIAKTAEPHLKRSANPHILTLSPPVSLEPRWLGPHVGYTIAKYGDDPVRPRVRRRVRR
jgi:NAD(P)-dependent dehydrogenase (short-subunit alcohol dehydrogenase family)